jgi:hypothetical protein
MNAGAAGARGTLRAPFTTPLTRTGGCFGVAGALAEGQFTAIDPGNRRHFRSAEYAAVFLVSRWDRVSGGQPRLRGDGGRRRERRPQRGGHGEDEEVPGEGILVDDVAGQAGQTVVALRRSAGSTATKTRTVAGRPIMAGLPG